jgi:hypothetical protein
MKTDTSPTLTVFRKFSDGEIIALFPCVPHDRSGLSCVSYMHVGQHGAASTDVVRITKPASQSEYTPLARELERIGYRLQIRQRIPANAYQLRRDAATL